MNKITTTSMKSFRPMVGHIAREKLRELGYEIEGSDDPMEVIFGMLVCLSEQIEELNRRELQK